MEPETFGGRGGRHVAEDAFHDRRIGRAPGQRRIADQRVAFAGARRFVVTVLLDVSFAGGGLREGHDTAQRQDIPRERLGDVRQIVFIIGVEIGAAEVHEQGLTCSLRTLLQVHGPVRRAVVERDGQLSQSVQVAPRVGLGGFDPQFVHAGFARQDRHAAVVPVPDETDAPTAVGLDAQHGLGRFAFGRIIEDDPLLVEREQCEGFFLGALAAGQCECGAEQSQRETPYFLSLFHGLRLLNCHERSRLYPCSGFFQ